MVDVLSDIDFPLLKTVDKDVYFKEQLAYFYANLSRKNYISDVLKLSKNLVTVLQNIKVKIRHDPNVVQYLELFYRMLAQTRDISNGKGEHELSYMMILAFYEVFPALAIYAIHRFCKPIEQAGAFGSWRDIKYLCNHIRLYSSKKENHELIKICVELMNSQLKKDIESWKFSVNAGSRNHISNVAKWIPREKKKFNWLFEMLVIDWIKTNKSYMFANTTDSWFSALTKAKRIYRKKVAFLNRVLDTTEIKQCSQNIEEIDPKNLTCHATMKNRSLIYTSNMKGQRNFTQNTDLVSNHYPVGFFVREAMLLCKNSNDHKYEINLLNNQWSWFSKTIPTYDFENTLPILDVSADMQKYDSNAFYTAIGYAIIMAERSSFGKRILAVDHQPVWINFESNENFVTIVENILNQLKSKSNTTFNIGRAIDLLILSLTQTKSTKRFIKNMTLILLSNNDEVNICEGTFKKHGFPLPNIILWSLEKYNIRELPTNGNIYSGMSNGVLKSLSALLCQIKSNEGDVFENIAFILNNPRYDIFGNYLHHVMNKHP
jgi:hypothetical protein